MKLRIFLTGVILIAILISGCISLEVHTKVNKDGIIENYRMEMTMNSMLYSILKEQAKKEGYSSVREYFLANVSKELSNQVTYNEKWEGNDVTIIIEAKNVKPLPNAKIKIYREGDYLIFKDTTFKSEKEQNEQDEFSEAFLASFRLDYYLEMPGKIVESNANVVEDNKAEWHLTGIDALNAEIYAKSEVPTIPGFELLVGVLGLIGAIGITFRNRMR